ncbi:MAG TPA: hypothetical protein VK308_06340 [Pyrinomonadaceae bacterium]|nr:hypothetical protein [Pyrinomonadaceae bacterium]
MLKCVQNEDLSGEHDVVALVLSLIMFVTLRTLTPIVENGDEDGDNQEKESGENESKSHGKPGTGKNTGG